MLGVTLHRNISQNLFFILMGSLVDFMECCNVFIKQKCNVSPYNFCKVLPYNLCKVSPYIPKLGSLFSILLNNFINLTFTFLKLCIMFRLDDARMILSVSPHVSSSWAIVTLLKSLYSLIPSNVVITNPHTEIRELQLFRTCWIPVILVIWTNLLDLTDMVNLMNLEILLTWIDFDGSE